MKRSPLFHLALGTLIIIFAYIGGVINHQPSYQCMSDSEWKYNVTPMPNFEKPTLEKSLGLPHNYDLIIKFKDGTPQSIISRFINTLNVNTLRTFSEMPSLEFISVTTSENLTLDEVIASYKANPNVEYVEPNFRYTIDSPAKKSPAIPNDPYFESLWGINNTGQEINNKPGGVSGVDINVLKAWELTTGDEQIVVGIVDTGIDYTHPDLKANMWVNDKEIPNNGIDDDGNGVIDDVYGYNAVEDNGNPMDDNDHGTHCAGTIGAAGDNGEGIVGVNWKVKLMGLKFLSGDGSGSLNDALETINYAIEMKKRGVNIRVLSNSWGGGDYSQALHDAIKELNKQGILFVAAAGNSATNTDKYPHYPSSYQADNVISVAAINNQDNLASFSNYGAKSVHVAAPGVDVYSTIPGNDYAYFSGTSMATPHVSGVAALMLAHDPNLTPKEIIHKMITTATPVAALKDKVVSGGRVNVYDAMTK